MAEAEKKDFTIRKGSLPPLSLAYFKGVSKTIEYDENKQNKGQI